MERRKGLLIMGGVVLLCWLLYINLRASTWATIVGNQDEQGITNLSAEQQALETGFLELSQQLRQEVEGDIDQELDKFLSKGMRAIVRPEDRSGVNLSNLYLREATDRIKGPLSFFNHIPLGNRSAIEIGLKMLDIFIQANNLRGDKVRAQVRDAVWTQYARFNPAFTVSDLTIDDYLDNLKEIIYVFHPDGKFKKYLAVRVVGEKYLPESDQDASVCLTISEVIEYCLGKSNKIMERLGSSPLLILEEFKILKFFLSFEDQSRVIAQRVKEVEDKVPEGNMSKAHYEWLCGGWKLKPDGDLGFN